MKPAAIGLLLLCAGVARCADTKKQPAAAPASTSLDFFERKIRPALVEHCYRCHAASAKNLKGGLRLDLRAGWQAGGDSGAPALVPGQPDASPLIQAIRHVDRDSAMPPDKPKLADAVLADFDAWVRMGAPDPRDGKLEPASAGRSNDWETIYRQRLAWWSLQPPARPKSPPIKDSKWVRNDIDPFILSALEARKLSPNSEADRRTLARRLSFALTGLPPDFQTVERFALDPAPTAYEDFVQSLLASPHFGERWARHWMDVVHYADTHGYEWDAPAKNAWMYRDYLIRAFNADLPFDRFILEQLAGDRIESRVDRLLGINEALIAPMALRLGERRHGDNAAAEGVTQEAMANIIDTVGKAFVGTTVACAQCHDHKLDAVAQRDYYGLAGVFMSTRWGVRCVDAVDPNVGTIAELRRIKRDIRAEAAKAWLGSKDAMVAKIKALPAKGKPTSGFPESLTSMWQRLQSTPITPAEFDKERRRRSAENQRNLQLLADFAKAEPIPGWQWDGAGMRHGLVADGAIVVADEGAASIAQILPAGRWSHVWSMRQAGALRSSLLQHDPPWTMSVEYAGGRHVGQSFIVDQAFHSERMRFLHRPTPGWLTLTVGNFDTLSGGVDRMPRRVYFEMVTKSLNNYFPPRFEYGGVKEADIGDPRSWFGVTRIYRHPPGKPPLDTLTRFAPLFESDAESKSANDDLPTRLANLILSAVERWRRDACDGEDARLLDDALQSKLLPNELQASARMSQLVEIYRQVEKRIQPDRTIGSMSDWNEGRDERIGIRGSYTDFGAPTPRGGIRFLGGPASRSCPTSTGRLELARGIADPNNPLTARVFVNRVWQYLFGEGLVRTPDDFGHLGDKPSHPELLDYLAVRFVNENWSLKKLVKLLVTSATWRQSSLPSPLGIKVDPENRLLHHMPMRRLEAEAIRDAMLTVSGRLDRSQFGPPIDPHRMAQDQAKRLQSGPIDGNGRRSIYIKMTLMEPPRFLALFNQPIPKLTTGRRDVTNVPNQALALLNDPFPNAMARHWSERLIADGSTCPQERIAQMFASAFARPPKPDEVKRCADFAQRLALLHGINAESLMSSRPVWQDLAHAIFNLQEFIYVQ